MYFNFRGDEMGREIDDTYRSGRRLTGRGNELEPVGNYSIRRRHDREAQDNAKPSGRGRLFLKQCAAAVIIIFACVMINKSGFEFGRNCLAALGRAVRWEFDFAAAWSGFLQWCSGVIEFWSDIF